VGTGAYTQQRWLEEGSDADVALAASLAGIKTVTSAPSRASPVASSASANFAAAAHASPSALTLPPSIHALAIRLRRPPSSPSTAVPVLRLTASTLVSHPLLVCVARAPAHSASLSGALPAHGPSAAPSAHTHSRSSLGDDPSPVSRGDANAADEVGWGGVQLAPASSAAPTSTPGSTATARARARTSSSSSSSPESSTTASLYLLFLLIVVSLPLYLLHIARKQLLEPGGQSQRLPTQELEDWVEELDEEESTAIGLGPDTASQSALHGGAATRSSAAALPKPAAKPAGLRATAGIDGPKAPVSKPTTTLCAAAILDDVPASSHPARHNRFVPTLPAPPGHNPHSKAASNLVWVDDETAVSRSIESRRHAKIRASDFD